MARFFSDENFPVKIVRELRRLGLDVVTVFDVGLGNRETPDPSILAFATAERRAVLTRNRRHFIKLHRLSALHAGIIVCTQDSDVLRQAMAIHEAVKDSDDLRGQLLRVYRPSR